MTPANPATTSSRRPRVICHMLTSIDGRIATRGWQLAPEGRRQYELVHASYKPDGWMCGRVTMEPFAKRLRSDAEVARQHPGGAPRDDYRAPGDLDSFAFAIDSKGRLAWQSNDIDGDHVGGMLRAGLIDEVSLLVAPVADGRMGTPALFDIESDSVTSYQLALSAVERRPGDILWLRYRVEPGAA